MKPIFVTIEGGEGSGKTTLINNLKKNFPGFLFTREPGGTNVGEQIREILLNGEEIKPSVEFFLFMADRAQHMDTVVFSAINSGQSVISDRWLDSTLVYQMIMSHFNEIKIVEVYRDFICDRWPDLTLLLDGDPEILLKRKESKNRIDKKHINFHRTVRNHYLRLAKEVFPDRFRVVDAELDEESIFVKASYFINMMLGG